ncbi:ATP-dependent DNA ligase [Cristinia sonorae]|uniref:DNA ligase n=1 Tax=Cristinia sonorae TaxID=1940300 RepID=A0A8K0XV37_9AGAR|nr:ATP-dependent DNA ligase [Cristinia sonorae]
MTPAHLSPRGVEVIDVDVDDGVSRVVLASPGTPRGLVPSLAPPSQSSSSSCRPPADTHSALLGSIGQVNPTSYQALTVDPPFYDLDSDPWATGTHAPYSFLAHTLSTLSGTRSRIVILNTLTNSLRTILKYHSPSILPALYLLSNTLSPPYLPLELGLGPSVISKAIQHVSGLTPAALKRLYNTTGDPGDVAFEAKSNIRTLIPHPPLSITGVYDSLLKIATAKGQGAAKQKRAIVEKLLVAAKGEETRYLVRTLCQNLRVGAVRISILTALARTMVLTPPSGLLDLDLQLGLYASAELIRDIKPMPSGGKKVPNDPRRDELSGKYITAEALMKKVYVQRPNYDQIVRALLSRGLSGIAERLPLTVGTPLLPTLGSPTRSLDEIYDRLGSLQFSAEFKYDGQRVQIHAIKEAADKLSVKLFSRHLEDMTDKYPDIILLIEHIFARSPQTASFILDAEIVAIDPLDESLKSFQELSNRARRDVQIDDVKICVCVFAFDIMYLDGQVLLQKPFRERRQLLRSHFTPLSPQQQGMARFDHVQSCESEDGRAAMEEFWELALNSRTEGLMIKLLDNGDVVEYPKGKKDNTRKKPLPATYEPDKRTSAWLKLKKDYVTGLGDSLDLVPIGAWHGNGRKAQWWSPILLALWNPASGRLVAVCKCMSGFTDAFYKDLRERYPEGSETCSREPRWDFKCDTGGLKPEVYFKPQEVWEICGADITISPVSVTAFGLVSATRGLSLRFPRFIRQREDKGIQDASTPEFLAKLWENQEAQGKDQTGADDGDLMDMAEDSEVEEVSGSD